MKELKLVSSSIALELNLESQARRESEAKLSKSLEDRVQMLRQRINQERMHREEARRQLSQNISDEVAKMNDVLHQEREIG